MISGKIAADRAFRSLEEGNTSQAFLKDYDAAVYKELWNELKLSRRLQQLLDYPFLFNLVVNKATKNEALSELISSMFEDLSVREQLKSPRFYWRLLSPFGGSSK